MELSRDTVKKIKELILFTVLVALALWKYEIVIQVVKFVWNLIFPFALGGAIAFVINVPMSSLEDKLFGKWKKENKKGLARALSMILTFALVIGLVILVIFVLVPQLVDTFKNLAESITAFLPHLRAWVGNFTNNNEDIMSLVNQLDFKPDQIVKKAVELLGMGAESVMSGTVEVIGTIVSGFATFFIAFTFSCYILIQKEKLHVQVRKIFFAFIPKRKAEVFLEIFSLTYQTFSNFLTGQRLEAVILGTMFVVTMGLLKLPYALLTGVVIAFTALIPLFGAFIGCFLGAFMIFIVNPKQAIIFIVLFLILQQVEGNLIYPHVVGGSVGLPSIWVLAAVSIGGELMGIVGMLIFIPIVSVLYTLFREYVYLKLKKNKIKKVTADDVTVYTPEEVALMEEAYRMEHMNDE